MTTNRWPRTQPATIISKSDSAGGTELIQHLTRGWSFELTDSTAIESRAKSGRKKSRATLH
jgi:hypothetical protein